jgi:hypothetical protein
VIRPAKNEEGTLVAGPRGTYLRWSCARLRDPDDTGSGADVLNAGVGYVLAVLL